MVPRSVWLKLQRNACTYTHTHTHFQTPSHTQIHITGLDCAYLGCVYPASELNEEAHHKWSFREVAFLNFCSLNTHRQSGCQEWVAELRIGVFVKKHYNVLFIRTEGLSKILVRLCVWGTCYHSVRNVLLSLLLLFKQIKRKIIQLQP